MRRAIDFSKHKRKGSSIFLSTPSARRATGRIDYETHRRNIFLSTPSARRATKRVTQKGGDRRFLSTPSARRATSRRAIRSLMGAYFYPRPPRGGRPTRAAATDSTEPISIHALREEGDCRPWTGGSCRYDFYPRPPRGGRPPAPTSQTRWVKNFYPRPPRGGRRGVCRSPSGHGNFYPRPPRGGRPTRAAATDSTEPISIHALREEGDCRPWTGGSCRYDFYPRPPRGGRQRDVCKRYPDG